MEPEKMIVNFLREEKNKIKLLKNIKILHSIGSYSTFTEFFGYKGESDEWKIMAQRLGKRIINFIL